MENNIVENCFNNKLGKHHHNYYREEINYSECKPTTVQTRFNISGNKYSRLTVLYPVNFDGVKQWMCLCDCGRMAIVRRGHLVSGKTKSCGCLQLEAIKEAKTTHGETNTRLYSIWVHMRERCSRKANINFHIYGGRGIRVCDEWDKSFEAFYEWAMANGYDENAPRGACTIDRIDVNGNYEPINCKWVSNREQQNNRRNNRLITHNGETKTVSEWSRITGINYRTLLSRVKRGNITDDEAITTKVKKCIK